MCYRNCHYRNRVVYGDDSESTILAFQEWKEYEDKVKNNLIDVNNEL